MRDLQRDIDCIVLGASAGGFEALHRIAAALPATFAPALLVVLHLPPDRPSGLAALLAERCALPVVEAIDKAAVDGGPDRGRAARLPPAGRAGPHARAVDRPAGAALASGDRPVVRERVVAYGERLLAVLLTGASGDGSAGVAAVRRRGGTAWVQDPADARAPTMPAAALQRAGADAVLTLAQICSRLAAAPTA